MELMKGMPAEDSIANFNFVVQFIDDNLRGDMNDNEAGYLIHNVMNLLEVFTLTNEMVETFEMLSLN